MDQYPDILQNFWIEQKTSRHIKWKWTNGLISIYVLEILQPGTCPREFFVAAPVIKGREFTNGWDTFDITSIGNDVQWTGNSDRVSLVDKVFDMIRTWNV